MSFEVYKWVIKPVLKEVVGRFETKEEVHEFVQKAMHDNCMTFEEIQEHIEVKEL